MAEYKAVPDSDKDESLLGGCTGKSATITAVMNVTAVFLSMAGGVGLSVRSAADNYETMPECRFDTVRTATDVSWQLLRRTGCELVSATTGVHHECPGIGARNQDHRT